MKCVEFHAEFLRGGISRAADAHLAGCAGCRSQLAELRSIRTVLESPGTWEEPGPDLEARVVADIRRTTADASPPTRRRLIALVAAAVIVIPLAVGALVSQRADWTLDLTPTAAAPEARATVAGWNTDHGTKLRLEVEGLPPTGPDAYYEIWLTAPDGRHVSGGTFNGPGTIESTIAVRRSDFPRVWVTVEPSDTNEALNGDTVLDTPGDW